MNHLGMNHVVNPPHLSFPTQHTNSLSCCVITMATDWQHNLMQPKFMAMGPIGIPQGGMHTRGLEHYK